MATLTGAQGIACGKYHAAVLTNNEDWEEKVIQAGKVSADLCSPVPYCPELHFPEFSSAIADMKNSVAVSNFFFPSNILYLFLKIPKRTDQTLKCLALVCLWPQIWDLNFRVFGFTLTWQLQYILAKEPLDMESLCCVHCSELTLNAKC